MKKDAWISEPKALVTGVEGAGKTLFCVEEAFLAAQAAGGDIYQVNIRGADPGHLPKLPFKLDEMGFDSAGAPVTDPETGDHLPRWAVDLPVGSVVIVDEAHKVYPQRGPGRPPKHIEMLAEGRQHGIRFIYMTQQPDSMDKFVRGRIGRHFHLERKGNMERATVLEFDHCVTEPSTAWAERKGATIHFWKFPPEFYGWYKSAKTHTFKRRIPLKIWAAGLFIPIALFLAYRGVSGVRHLTSDTLSGHGATAATGSGEGVVSGAITGAVPRGGNENEVVTDAAVYVKQFTPLVASLPWSAPAYQGRGVVAQPDLYCIASGRGSDALGKVSGAGCHCFTEQGTKAYVAVDMCQTIVEQGGVYNPFRSPIGGGDSGMPERGRSARPLAPRGDVGVPAGGQSAGSSSVSQVASYGSFRTGS